MRFRNQTMAQKIAAIGPTDDCVLWDGAVDWDGYPRVHYRGRTQAGQRVSYLIHVGPIPYKHWVIRTCGNILCLNPRHLELQKAGNPSSPSSTPGSSKPKFEEVPLPFAMDAEETSAPPVIDTIVHDNETNEWHAFYWENQKMVKYGVFDEYDSAAYALTDYLKERA